MSVGPRFARLRKSPGDDMPYNWDYSDEDVFLTYAIQSAVVTDWQGAAVPVSLTVSAAAISGRIVQTRISGGTAGTVYYLKCKATSAVPPSAADGYDREAFLELTVDIPTPDA